jgi:uncharacterized membrane protein
VRIALGVLLVLFFPGYVLLAALFPRRGNLDGIERIALSLGLSFALAPLIGLALHFTPWGIRPVPIVFTLSLWTVGLAAVAWRQRRILAPNERFEIQWEPLIGWLRKPRTVVDIAVAAVLVVAAVGAIGTTVWRVANPSSGETFTEFYVLGAEHTLQNYPTILSVGVPQDYNIGIVNQEQRSVAYAVRVFLAGDQVGFIDPIALQDGERWEGQIGFAPSEPGEQLRLELRLYRDGGDEPYRNLHLFVDVLELS